MPNPELPYPQRERWQPLRLGLVDIFYYDREEFQFRDGHLLLRGNNGAGKSKVLALTLPFLLDGDTRPARVEPDGDAGKRMEWNLLLNRDLSERLGYTWIEFGRVLADGSCITVTLGCGLKAVRGRPVRTWYFITGQRLGVDFELIGPGGYALSRERLQEALNGHGTLYDSASSYRRAVDEKLFQLGQERYDTLINLLIQLRQPQLSKRPNEQALSDALSRALPPLEQKVLSDVAEAFRSLEGLHDELRGFEEAAAAVTDFQAHYRAYAQIAARLRAAEVGQAQTRCERLGSDLKQLREQWQQTDRAQQTTQQRLTEIDSEQRQVSIEERTLRDSPEMRSRQELARAEEQAADRAEWAAQAQGSLADAERQAEKFRVRQQERHAQFSGSRDVLYVRLADAERQAAAADCAALLATARAPLWPDAEPAAGGSVWEQQLAAADQSMQDTLQRRQRDIEHIRDLNKKLAVAEQERQRQRERWQDAQDRLARQDEALLQTREQTASAGSDYVTAVRRYLGSVQELLVTATAAESVLATLDNWVTTLSGTNPAALAVAAAYDAGTRTLAADQAQRQLEEQDLRTQCADLRRERERLQAGGHEQPPVPYTRSASRQGRPGAPLWQVVDFCPALAAAERAGLEAALEAAGLLDAWLLPDGVLLDAQTGDVRLLPQTATDHNLNRWLQVALNSDDPQAALLTVATVTAVLAGIGTDMTGSVWVMPDGSWRLGPAQGAWNKAEACYIGHGAREAARRRRLAEIAEQLTLLAAQQVQLAEQLTALAARQTTLGQEKQALPSDETLRGLHQQVALLQAERQRVQADCERAAAQLTRCEHNVTERSGERDRSAAELHLPSAPAALDRLATALQDYRQTLMSLWSALRDEREKRQELARAQVDYDEAIIKQQKQAEAAASAIQAAQAAAAERDALLQTVGVAAQQLEQQLNTVIRRINELKQEKQRLDDKYVEQRSEASRLRDREQSVETDLHQQREQRQRAIMFLQDFTADGLLTAALPDLPPPTRRDAWPIEVGVKLARQIEQALQGVDASDAAWHRQQSGLLARVTDLQSALSRHAITASTELSVQSLLLVRAVFKGQLLGPDALRAGLDSEVAEHQALLNARERELLENHLINEVASQLHSMIAAAERQVQVINRELASRPTSAGMKLRLLWPVRSDDNAPVGLAEARQRLLRQNLDAWSVMDREAVGQFLQNHIKRIRDNNEGGTLLTHLEKALDYRDWHRFRVERWQDGAWRSATGPASGGERALAMTLPLFAAASSYYSSTPQAPRLVLLDEVFAGVDDNARAKCMGLLAQFDLDFVMTSEREWGCYAELPGLAIVQLARRDGIDAVHVSRWTWDGHSRSRVVELSPPLVAVIAENSAQGSLL